MKNMKMLTFKYHLIMTFKMTLLEISVLFTVENGVNLILNSFCHHVSPCLTLMNAIKEISNFIKIQLCTGERRPASIVNHIRRWNYMQKSKKQHYVQLSHLKTHSSSTINLNWSNYPLKNHLKNPVDKSDSKESPSFCQKYKRWRERRLSTN